LFVLDNAENNKQTLTTVGAGLGALVGAGVGDTDGAAVGANCFVLNDKKQKQKRV
jgi:hypothetical protein